MPQITLEEYNSLRKRGATFVVFHYVISVIICPLNYKSKVFFVNKKDYISKGLPYSFITLLFGWWSKGGISSSIHALINNFTCMDGAPEIEKIIYWELKYNNGENIPWLKKSGI